MAGPASKEAVRRDVLAALARMPPPRRAFEEDLVTAGVQQEPAWRAAQRVLLYRSAGHELSTVGLANAAWRAGKAVAFPRMAGERLEVVPCVSWDDLVRGAHGIMEPRPGLPPVPATWADLVVVPGVAFTRNGHRVGRGAGHYDRFLADVRAPVWGLAFDAQVVPQLATEGHDRQLDRVVQPATYLLP